MFGLALGLFVLGYHAGNRYQQPEKLELSSAVLLQPALDVPQFNAAFSDGTPLDRDWLRKRWSLLLIGPSDTHQVQAGLRLLIRTLNRMEAFPEARKALHPLYLSPAPKQDTPSRLDELRHLYQRNFQTASGDKENLHDLFAALGVNSSLQDASFYLINPQAQVPALFTAPTDPAKIARDIEVFMRSTAYREESAK